MPLSVSVVGNWHVRSAPSEKANSLKIANNGERLTVVEVRPDGWLLLADGGYICGRAVGLSERCE
jgi:hypothetical protein